MIFYTLRDRVGPMSIRMRHTRGHTGNRRSHHALKRMNVVKDESGNLRLPHRIDEATGMYRGKQIFAPKPKAERKSKVKTSDTKPVAKHEHDHTHEHANAEVKAATGQERKGLFSRFVKGGRPKARSGFGGGA